MLRDENHVCVFFYRVLLQCCSAAHVRPTHCILGARRAVAWAVGFAIVFDLFGDDGWWARAESPSFEVVQITLMPNSLCLIKVAPETKA
jgi:hypothetical protein